MLRLQKNAAVVGACNLHMQVLYKMAYKLLILVLYGYEQHT